VLAPVQTCGDSSACDCAIFDSSAAAKAAEWAVNESKLLLKCRRDGCRTFVAGIMPAEDRGQKRGQTQRHLSIHGAKVRTERESAVCPRGGISCGWGWRRRVSSASPEAPSVRPSVHPRAREGEGGRESEVIAHPANCAHFSFKPATIVNLRGKYSLERRAMQFVGTLNRSTPETPFFGGRETPLNFQRFSFSGIAIWLHDLCLWKSKETIS
jgi:hypothetical protein